MPRALNILGAVCVLVLVCELVFLAQVKPQAASMDQEQSASEAAEATEAVVKQAVAAPEEEPAEVVEPRETKFELEGDSAESVKASNAFGTLTQAIGNFEDKGYKLAFVIHDINTGHEITYDSDEELYPASSIKAPFTACVYEELVETGKVSLESVEPVAEITILESSDDGYRTLHARYGEQVFIKWLKDAGVEPGSYGSYESMVSWNYPHISARQLEQMWEHIYDYLTTDTDAAKQLADLLERRYVSSLRKALPYGMRSWSKMGWFDSFNNYRSEPATVEAGVVFDEPSPYILSIETTAPAELNALIPIHQALYQTHKQMA